MRPTFAVLALLLPTLAAAAPSRPDWHLRMAVGQSVSEGHGSALELALSTPVREGLALGMESGLGYMRVAPRFTPAYLYDAASADRIGSSLTDGITRHRAFFVAPMLRWGGTLHVVASYGLYDVFDTQGAPDYVQGVSAGLGLGESGRGQPSAELRWRYASDRPFSPERSFSGNSLSFTFGVSL